MDVTLSILLRLGVEGCCDKRRTSLVCEETQDYLVYLLVEDI
jgi:hypothetical protein